MGLTLSRRELLTAFLGAPLAAATCRIRSTSPLPLGVLVGASAEVGHRLRQSPRPLPGKAWQEKQVVIIGAGVAGLSAAWRLAHAGVKDFILLELEEVPGGTARSGQSAVSAFPWGAHYIPVPMRENRALIRLLGEMNALEGIDADGEPIVREELLCRDPQERLFYRGRWYEGLYLSAGASDEDLRQLQSFEKEIARWVGWRDAKGRRAFTIPTAYSSDDAEVMELDRISMRQWLDQHGFNSSRLRWYVEYACRDDYGALLDDTSAWAGVFYFASRVPAPGRDSEPLITWPEGNGRLVAHLAQASKGQLQTGRLATDVVPPTTSLPEASASHPIGVVACDRLGEDALGFNARHVIYAAPQFTWPHVLRAHDNAPSHVAEFTYGSWMVANLTLRDRPESVGFPLAWDNVFYDSPSLGYVDATHQSDVDRGPTVFTYYYPLTDHDPHVARRRMLSAGRDEWAEIALADISRAHPEIRALTTRVDIMRWGHAMIRPTPGFITSAARRNAREPFQGIHFAHSDLSGVALFEEAFYQGIRAAEEVLAARGELTTSFL